MIKPQLIILQIFMFLLLSSCNQTETYNVNSDKITAYIDTILIALNQVDSKIRQEIYDELSRIYLIRKIALDEIIKEKLLSLEAEKYKMTVSNLLDSLYQKGINDKSLQKYISVNQYERGIPALERSLGYYDINSTKGKEILIKRFKESRIKDYVDSLKTVYKITVLLKKPAPPSIKIENLLVHFKGNLKSRVTLLVISDFECEMCRKYNPVFDSLYAKYKDQIRYGFINYGSYPTISAIASESAAQYGKFWEMHDSLFSSLTLPDTIAIFRLAENLDIEISEFKNDFFDKNLKTRIEDNLYMINNAGVYATPTVLINNKPVFNSSSFTEIQQMILNELSTLK